MSVKLYFKTFCWLWIAVLMLMSGQSQAEIIERSFTVSFGTQAIVAPVKVSSVNPIVSKIVSFPPVNCGACRGSSQDYTYDVEWVADQGYLDIERTQLVMNNNGSGSQAWVFSPSRSSSDLIRNVETIIRRHGSMGNTTCDPISPSNDFYQCKLINGSGNAVPAIDLEIGILITGPNVQPGDISTLDRKLLTRVVTFKKENIVVVQYKDTVRVKGSTTLASCNINTGSLQFNLPARSINVMTYENYGVKTQMPSDGVRRELRLACVGNTELNIHFTPMTMTVDQQRILLAKKSDGTDSQVGFQLWFYSSQWPGSQNYQLVKWDNSMTSLFSQSKLPEPRPASAPDIILSFMASYAIESDTTLSNVDAGPIVAKGMYTLSYQ